MMQTLSLQGSAEHASGAPATTQADSQRCKTSRFWYMGDHRNYIKPRPAPQAARLERPLNSVSPVNRGLLVAKPVPVMGHVKKFCP
jgi:hypothetical protein